MNRNLPFALVASGFIAVASGAAFFLISGPAEPIGPEASAAVGGAPGNYEIAVTSDGNSGGSRALTVAKREANGASAIRRPPVAAPVGADEHANAGVTAAGRTPGDIAVSMREEPGSQAIRDAGFERASYISAGREIRDGGVAGRVVSRAESFPGRSGEKASGSDVLPSENAIAAGAESAALENRQFAEKQAAKSSGTFAATSAESAQIEVAPPVRRRTRAWPKPFTADEERFRQRVGVQPYINLQHEWATGQKRE